MSDDTKKAVEAAADRVEYVQGWRIWSYETDTKCLVLSHPTGRTLRLYEQAVLSALMQASNDEEVAR